MITAEYIWIDGTEPTHKLRSKTKILNNYKPDCRIEDFPEWGFDGSSTHQAPGDKSDCILKPVVSCRDPIRQKTMVGAYLVLCEVFSANGSPHPTNTRAELRRVLDAGAQKSGPWFGIEQEYTLFKGRWPLGWPDGGYPPPQGPFYCGVGADEVFGRPLVEAHLSACLDAGLAVTGINAEVMPGQWEFQIGTADPLTVSDHLWLARWILYRLGEDYGITVRLDPKPVEGDWNGAGAHTNFSTVAMRDSVHNLGMAAITNACEMLGAKAAEHIACYGYGIEKRLTGKHETCSYKEFRYGVSDRGASIRIPLHVAQNGYGYLEDRRPCANIDPYVVTARILKTVCEID